MISRRASSLVLAINAAIFLGAANWVVFEKEEILATGQRVLLGIRQYDPRSLMQGDYMALNYTICDEIDAKLVVGEIGDGRAVISVHGEGVGRLRRLDDGSPLATDECFLRYKVRWGRRSRVRVAAESFFFEEGMSVDLARARYAELRVDAEGRTLLVALCDPHGARLGQAK